MYRHANTKFIRTKFSCRSACCSCLFARTYRTCFSGYMVSGIRRGLTCNNIILLRISGPGNTVNAIPVDCRLTDNVIRCGHQSFYLYPGTDYFVRFRRITRSCCRRFRCTAPGLFGTVSAVIYYYHPSIYMRRSAIVKPNGKKNGESLIK